MMNVDLQWMQHALTLARQAEERNEVPVGAVLVHENNLIAEGYNQPISACDPTAHAEIIALRAGAKKLNNYRLLDTTLYVTLEPCVMCLGAIMHARVKRLVFASPDPKVSSTQALIGATYFNHSLEINSGILAEESSEMLKKFFVKRRG